MKSADTWGAAPLSAIDWRFLLPSPPGAPRARIAVLGGDGSAARAARDAGLADEVVEHIAPGARLDAIADLTGSVDLRTLGASLAEGGAAFVVVRRRGRGRGPSPEVLRAKLHARGLEIAGVYAGIPDLRHPRAIVPLDARHAFRWYVEVLSRAPTSVAFVRERVLRMLTDLDGARVGRVVPDYAVVVVRADDAGARSACAEALATLDGREPPDGTRPLLLTAGSDRVVALPFSPEGRTPLAVLKIPRAPAFESRTEADQTALGELRGRLPADLREALPAPLGTARHRGALVARESAMPGRTLLRASGSWATSPEKRAEDLRLAGEWIARFHRETESRRAPLARERERWLDGPIEAYDRTFAATADERVLFARVLARAAELGDELLPIVTMHGDYSVWNVLRSNGAVSVVDWEGAREGPALLDVLHLATGWYEAVRAALTTERKLRRFRALFLADGVATRACAVARREIARYTASMSMSPRLLAPLLVSARIELALRVAAQRRDAGMSEERAHARAGNPAVPFVELLAGHADALFERDEAAALRAPRAR